MSSDTFTRQGPVVILSERSPTGYALINQLRHHFDVQLVVFERHGWQSKLRLLQRRRRRLGTWIVVQQCLFLTWDIVRIRPYSRERNAALLSACDTSPPTSLRTLDVARINDPVVVDAVEAVHPVCGVVAGTSILRRPLLDTLPIWLNLHCGITPRYRGAHGAFWAIYEGRPDQAGVTVHQIDAGVDTGDIVEQAVIEIEPNDTYRTLAVKQYLRAIPLMMRAVEETLEGRLTTYRRGDEVSKLWFSPTPLQYVRFCRQLRRLCRG